MKTKFSNVKTSRQLAVAVAGLFLVATAAHAQYPYSNAVASLNPAGYWPMHEVEASAAGDIETNYGTLGPLGDGYYPDWAPGDGLGVKRGIPGPIPSSSDESVWFTYATTAYTTGLFTNTMYIPHTSPLTTLNPPFTVEFWADSTNADNDYPWCQFGFSGLNNAGGSGSGGGSYQGIAINANGSVFGLFLYPGAVEPFTISYSHNKWYYLTVTCDAQTNFTLYENGVAAGTTTSEVGKYLPDSWTPQTIGGGRGGTRAFGGFIGEYAVYTNVLSTFQITNHYDTGTNDLAGGPATNYFAVITNDNPLIYLRMISPTTYIPGSPLPTLYNYGSAGANGVYTPGTMPGIVSNSIVNRNGVPWGGVTNIVAALSGISSFADVGYVPAYNPVGDTAFSVTALFRGDPCDNRLQTIVGNSSFSWAINMTTSGTLQCQLGTNTTSLVTSAGVYNDGKWHQVVEVYTTNSIAGQPGTNAIYVDGVLDGWTNNVTPNGILPGTNLDMMIGADPQYTNSPPALGRQFAGQICDAAFFTNSLTVGQIQMLYSNCGVVPIITTQPQSYSVNQGVDFTSMGVVAKGSGTLSYQWYTNGVGIAGQTASNLVWNPVVSSDASADYYVVVSNLYGSATSSVASLTVIATPIFTELLPVTYNPVNNTNYLTLYPGVSPNFVAVAGGAQPIGYFWFTNGVNIAGQNSTNFTLANVPICTNIVYCVASNSVGTATNFWNVSVIAAPTNSMGGPAPYPQQVLSNNPIAYWRLNDYNPEGDNQNGDDGYYANDYVAGNNGLYTNVYLGQTSYSPTTDPSDSSVYMGDFGPSFPNVANNFAGGILGIDFATTNGANAEFSVEAWANGNQAQQANPGAVITQGKYGISDAFFLGLDSSHHYEFYVRNAAGTQFTADSSFEPDGNWHHVAGVCDEANGLVSLYIDGHVVVTSSITNSGLYEASAPISIGAGTGDGVNFVYQFLGYLNDVALYNYALTASNVASQYVSLGFAPTVSPAPPATVAAVAGGPLTIPALAVGTPTSGYYWTDENAMANVAAGTTNGAILNATFTTNSVPASWNLDTLELTVTNAYGQNTYSVQLNINTNPAQITLNLPSPVTVVQGQSYVYSIAAEAALFYQWYNAGMPILNATNASYTVTAGAPGNTTYYVVVSNGVSMITSAVSTFTSISATPQALTSGYATNVLNLNPVGYWPMHEVESPAQGDIENNYGSLGFVGDGYYPDWALGDQGGIARDYPGALPGDPDPAVDFTFGSALAGDWTNALYVPHTSPLTTLNPPFSVECWCYPTALTAGEAVWCQFGFEGLNAGSSGFGNGRYDGAYFDYAASISTFSFYGEDNGVQTQLAVGGSGVSVNHWYHLVVTCDVQTNFTVWINGVEGSTVAGVGKYSPDYWTPLTVANGRGSTRAMACGMDEFAVYTNVISDITAHYNDGISGAAGAYFDAVTNDNPVIYLRMDSPSYSAPSANFWPVLFNYGSAGNNGLYTPGTMPGIVPGPANHGVPLAELSGPNVAQLSGVGSFADAGYATAFNPTGPMPFSVSAMFRGNPCDGRVQAIVGHSTNSWGIWMNTSGQLVSYLGTNGSLTSSGVYNDGNWHQIVAVYTPNANPALTGTGAIYVDGTLDTSVSTVSTNGIEPGSPLDVMIGSDPQFTNTPAGVGASFAGQVCEVALFTNALTAAQVAADYQASGLVLPVNPNPTNIVASVTNAVLYLTWPTDHTGWQLQAQTNPVIVGISTNWANYNPSTGTNQVVIPINLTNGTVFYRLIYTP